MRIGVVLIGVLCWNISTTAPADSPTTQPQTLTPASSVDDILNALDTRGAGLQDFTASVRLSSVNNVNGKSSAESGTVSYQKKSNGDARIRVVFNKLTDDVGSKDQNHEYTLDNGWLVERNYDKKIEVRRQVLKPGQKMDPLKLGEGPFPLPIGQKKADVEELFSVVKVAPDKDDPPGTVHLQLTPKPGTSFAKTFQIIDVWVDMATVMPTRIQTLDIAGTTSKTTDLSNVKTNVGLGDKDFSEPELQGDWDTHSEQYNQ